MTGSQATLPAGWAYGVHPHATGAVVHSISEVDLRLGGALRVEMRSGADAGERVHLQYYIDTHFGGWALWLTCPPAELGAREAALRSLEPVILE